LHAAARAVRLRPVSSRFSANADYEDRDVYPLELQPGDEVTVGSADRVWPGWVWAEDRRGRTGYVPEEILKPLGEGRHAVLEAYDPRVLCVKRGEQLESLRHIHGWHWCRNPQGEEGWVPAYLLKAEKSV
jgi:hypothetical protein